jgi:tetratricopeptide (TPR) repeat protein
MPKMFLLACTSLSFLVLLAVGCKPKAAETTATPTRPVYFKTSFQDESEFIVESIVSDLAQQMYYAAHQQLPDHQHFRVAATERRGSLQDPLVYDLLVRFDAKTPHTTTDLKINGPIWSPALYRSIAAKLAQAVGLTVAPSAATVEPGQIPTLSDGTADTLAREDQAVSALLEKDFRNPELHERAALLLGAFLFRDHSGHFLEIRTPLSRISAHLIMAQFLRSAGSYGLNGQLAEATLFTLINCETAALELLGSIATNRSDVVALVRTLRCRATGDYRTIGQLKDASPIERVEYLCSKAGYVGAPSAWRELTDSEQQTVDFVRTAHQSRSSVEMGHQLLRSSLQLEISEITNVYALTHQEKLNPNDLVQALNELPDGCFRTDSKNQAHVEVIGWGQWALFLQRHFCHAIEENHRFLSTMLGVPDDAKQYAAAFDPSMADLRLYPFVRRFTCSTVEEYHKSVDDAAAVTVASPHLVPADCWNYLGYKVRFAPLYSPTPPLHINPWFRYDPPPGTAYDLSARLYHTSLMSEDPDAVARLEKLHQLAPFDTRISSTIIKTKYHDHPTYDQAIALYGPVMEYSVPAMRVVAGTLSDKPEQYEQLMLKAAQLEPSCYYDLGDYLIGRKQEEKAAKYIDQACDHDPDAVRVASHSVWRVQYCLKTGQVEKARQIADEAAEVYSYRGLEAKALFLEQTTNFDGAFEWFSKIEERYNDSNPLLNFCFRYQIKAQDDRFKPEVKKRLGKLFPHGLENVALNDLHGPPPDGVLIRQENDLVKSAGLKAGDVIVAVYGTRVHNLLQYYYARDLKPNPQLDLIAWQTNSYREFNPSPPHHRFGVEFDTYATQTAASRSSH